jgi:hypothetical protein
VTLPGGDRLALVLLLTALVAAAVWAPRLAELLPRPVEEKATRPAPAPAPPRKELAEIQKKISVKLYFEHPEQPALVAEPREIAYAAELPQQLRGLIEELVKGSATGSLGPLPAETKVLAVFLDARGTAFVDVSKEAVAGGAGSLEERLRVYAIVNSVVANFPAVRRVQILVDDKPVETFAGHVDLSRPLAPDMTLVATQAAPVEASPQPESTPSPAPAKSPSA